MRYKIISYIINKINDRQLNMHYIGANEKLATKYMQLETIKNKLIHKKRRYKKRS